MRSPAGLQLQPAGLQLLLLLLLLPAHSDTVLRGPVDLDKVVTTGQSCEHMEDGTKCTKRCVALNCDPLFGARCWKGLCKRGGQHPCTDPNHACCCGDCTKPQNENKDCKFKKTKNKNRIPPPGVLLAPTGEGTEEPVVDGSGEPAGDGSGELANATDNTTIGEAVFLRGPVDNSIVLMEHQSCEDMEDGTRCTKACEHISCWDTARCWKGQCKRGPHHGHDGHDGFHKHHPCDIGRDHSCCCGSCYKPQDDPENSYCNFNHKDFDPQYNKNKNKKKNKNKNKNKNKDKTKNKNKKPRKGDAGPGSVGGPIIHLMRGLSAE